MFLLRALTAPLAALAALALAAAPDAAQARPADQTFRLADPAGGDIETTVWLPEAAAFAGPRPLIVISHGNGGHAAGHHDTAEALAAAGFVVAAVTHPGDNWRDDSRQTQLSGRPRHIRLLIDHMTTLWSGPVAVDPTRIGAFGFSAGGFTVTALIGGVSDPALIQDHCEAEPDVFACRLIRRSPLDLSTWTPVGHDPRIKAAVIAAPGLGLAFTTGSLARVTVPVQLWQADADEVLPAPFNVEPIRDRLGRPPEYHRVASAGHFDFLPPCSEALAAAIPLLCQSRPGFDRAAFHRAFNREVARFFRDSL
ncbi:alpha/beta hydrolase family protein [Brevundimonas sp. GCM10030266]|uniref:alpha/beta hydrolase family protein n=1 Tax=Brevundimonas sp. GCM10030266 TaxID=3273386 RepID=UPI003610572A